MAPWRSLAVSLVLAGLLAVTAAEARDVLGVYTEPGDDGRATLDLAGGSATVYLIASDLTCPWGIGGWECHLAGDWEANPDIFFAGHVLRGEAFNVSAFPDFAVGLGSPMFPDGFGQVVLAEISFIFFSQQVLELYLAPADRPSLPGLMCYAPTNDPGYLIPFTWSSVIESRPVFGFNTGPIQPRAARSWGHVKALYRTGR
jgi:hypothetical protein